MDPALFATPDYHFDNPLALLVAPDHYLLRMLYAQGVPYTQLLDIDDPRQGWQTFADHFHLFRGTPSGLWLAHELAGVFGVEEKLDSSSAQPIYDQIQAALAAPGFTPRRLFEAWNIEVLATTDAATDTLDQHAAIRASGWHGRIVPTFRPDGVVNLLNPTWAQQIARLAAVSGEPIRDYRAYIRALEQRRGAFKAMGATATDISAVTRRYGSACPKRGGCHLPACAAGPGRRGRRRTLYRPYAVRDGADERRRRPGHAAALRVAAQP